MFERVYCKVIKERLEDPILTACNPTTGAMATMKWTLS